MLSALQAFAERVTAKTTGVAGGDPEDQLRGPLEELLQEVGTMLGLRLVATGEVRVAGRIGRPDYAVQINDLLAGYIEVKAPGKGANPKKYRGHDKRQWARYQVLPNLIYTDGDEWGLYRSGERIGAMVRMSGEVSADGKGAVNLDDADALLTLLRNYFSWEPGIPEQMKAKDLAAWLAPYCRYLREEVTEALSDEQSPLIQVATDWRQLLFPDASDARFADAYAQTVTFALLLARSEGANPLTLESASAELSGQHTLLSRALQVLTDPQARQEIEASLNLLVRIIGCIPLDAMTNGERDPWLYFYEDFLAAYDPKLRKDAGAYYTPVEVVRAQVRLVDELLVTRMGKPLGLAEDDVITLDPAVGTGTYLLGIIQHTLQRVEETEGAGAVPGRAGILARNLHGFEIMVGPNAVSELRVTRGLLERGARLAEDEPHIYLTDTLESPHTDPPQLPMYLQPIADQHKKALRIKDQVPVIVCLGNPPYDRHAAANGGERRQSGGDGGMGAVGR